MEQSEQVVAHNSDYDSDDDTGVVYGDSVDMIKKWTTDDMIKDLAARSKNLQKEVPNCPQDFVEDRRKCTEDQCEKVPKQGGFCHFHAKGRGLLPSCKELDCSKAAAGGRNGYCCAHATARGC